MTTLAAFPSKSHHDTVRPPNVSLTSSLIISSPLASLLHPALPLPFFSAWAHSSSPLQHTPATPPPLPHLIPLFPPRITMQRSQSYTKFEMASDINAQHDLDMDLESGYQGPSWSTSRPASANAPAPAVAYATATATATALSMGSATAKTRPISPSSSSTSERRRFKIPLPVPVTPLPQYPYSQHQHPSSPQSYRSTPSSPTSRVHEKERFFKNPYELTSIPYAFDRNWTDVFRDGASFSFLVYLLAATLVGLIVVVHVLGGSGYGWLFRHVGRAYRGCSILRFFSDGFLRMVFAVIRPDIQRACRL
jgi:hypothetical protein